jgi:tetratricopeptide (TPR) repeat protein
VHPKRNGGNSGNSNIIAAEASNKRLLPAPSEHYLALAVEVDEMKILRRFLDRSRNASLDEIKRILKEQEGDTAMLFLSNCLIAFGKADYKEAMRHISAGLTENPDDPKLLLWRGIIHFKEYRYKEAVEAFRKALQVDPTCEDAKNMLSCQELSIYSGVADRLRDI